MYKISKRFICLLLILFSFCDLRYTVERLISRRFLVCRKALFKTTIVYIHYIGLENASSHVYEGILNKKSSPLGKIEYSVVKCLLIHVRYRTIDE